MQSQDSQSDHLTDLPVFNSITDSSNSINKDAVLDQMEAKLGELLQTNQELYSVKTHNVTLKEMNMHLQTQLDQEKQLSEQIITRLREENSEKSSQIADMKDKLDEYAKKSEQLFSNNELLVQKLQESENEHQIKMNEQTNELDSLKSSLENKVSEINELKKELDDMKSQNSSHSETILQTRIENEKLAAQKTSEAKENQNLKENIEQLTRELTSKKQKYQQLKETHQQLMLTNNKYENEIIKLKQKNQIYKERAAALDNNLQQAKTMIRQVLNCQAPRFKSIDDLIASHRNQIEEINELRGKMKSQEKAMKKIAFAIQKYEEKVTELNEIVDNTKITNSEMQTKIDDQTKQIQLLELKNQAKVRKLSILPVYEKVINNLNDKIDSIAEIVQPEECEMSIRTLLIFVIMLKRWKSLVGLLPKNFINDSRNWWWMNSKERSKTIVADVDYLVTSLKDEIEKYKAISTELQKEIGQYQNNLHAAEEQSLKSTQTIQSSSKTIAELQAQVQELTKLTEDQVSNADHQNLIDKHAKTKMKLKDCRETIKEKETEIKNLKTELAKTETELSSQYMKSKQKDRLLEDAKYQLYNAQNGITHLQNGYNMKTREVLSLERGIQKEQNNIIGYNAQNSILALENRRLNFQIAKQNRLLTSSPPDHQYVESK